LHTNVSAPPGPAAHPTDGPPGGPADGPAVGSPTAGPVAGPGPVRAWPVLLLAAPAFVAIWSGWVGLGELTGFGRVKLLPGIWDALAVDTAITLPIGVETYAAYALRVWLTAPPGLPVRAVWFARVSAIASLVLGAAGQIAYHLMTAAHVTAAPWWIVTVVACLPVAVLGMGAALAHLVRHSAPDNPPDTAGGSVSDTAGGSVSDTAGGSVSDTTGGSVSDTAGGRGVRPRTKSEPRAGGDGKPRRVSVSADVARLRSRYPDMSPAEIARRVKVTERTVQRHLAALAPAGGGAEPDGPAEQMSAVPTRVMEVVR
jgi:hypothetical protein